MSNTRRIKRNLIAHLDLNLVIFGIPSSQNDVVETGDKSMGCWEVRMSNVRGGRQEF